MPSGSGYYQMYRDVPPERREWLRSFRLRHPLQHLTWQGIEWGYIASDAPGEVAQPTEHWVVKQNHTQSRQDEVVMVLGGATSTAESSFELLTVLERHYKIFSPTYPQVDTIDDLLKGLIALLDAVGIPRVHIYGHSLGAAVAHVFVREYPNRLGKVVLSSYGLHSETRARRTRRVLRIVPYLPYGLIRRHFVQRMAQSLSNVHDQGDAAFMMAYAKDLLGVQHTRATLNSRFRLMADMIDHGDAYGVHELVEHSGEILILQATDDPGYDLSEREALVATYSDAQVQQFETGGHSLRIGNRDAYDRILLEFLSS